MAPLRTSRLPFSLLLKIFGVVALCLVIGWYAYFQARFLIEGPQITLDSPATISQNQQIVPVRGTAKNVTEVTLNGRTIHTSEDGSFEEFLILPKGYTIMTLHAEDRYGRARSLAQSLVYTPADAISFNP